MDGILTESNGNRTQVRLNFENTAVHVFKKNEANLWFTIDVGHLDLSMGGSKDSLIFLKSNQEAPGVIYVESEASHISILRDQLYGKCRIDAKVEKAFKSPNKIKYSGWLFAGLAFLAFAIIIQFRQPIFGSLSILIPFSLEKKVADQFFNPALTKEQLALQEQLFELVKRIQIPQNEWSPELTIHISSDTLPNAYATLGGHIFINKGLISLLSTSDELLGVVAHEIAHVQRRHVVRSILQSLGLYSFLALMFGDLTGISAVIIENGAPMLNLHYSRGLEEEADRVAIIWLTQSQINPVGLASALEKINGESKKLIKQNPGSEILEKINSIELLSSHPDPVMRVEEIRRKSLSFKPNADEAVIFDYENFKKEVKEHF